jgi:hypothetical protein
MSQEKIIDKIAKLKAHAESAAKIGNEAEAEAFAEMMQRLLLKHKIEMSDLEFANMERVEPVDKHRVDYDKYNMHVKGTRVEWIERLATIVARAHFCRILVHLGSSRISMVGRKSDFEVAEYMLITLQRAIEHMSDKAAYHYRLECQRNGAPRMANGFRAAYIDHFVRRLADRYEAERQAQSGATSMALVRVNKSEGAVDDYMFQNFGGKRKATALSTQHSWHAEGAKRGREAADAVNLKANAVKSGSTPQGFLG